MPCGDHAAVLLQEPRAGWSLRDIRQILVLDCSYTFHFTQIYIHYVSVNCVSVCVLECVFEYPSV